MIPQNDNAIIPIAAALQQPDDLWRAVIAYLKSQNQKADIKSLAAVSKHMLALWRDSVLTLHVPLYFIPQNLEDTGPPDTIGNGALDMLEEDVLSAYPNALWVTIQMVNGFQNWPKDYNHHIAARGFPPHENAVSIDLRLNSTTSFNRSLEVMRDCPEVANRVNLLSIVQIDWREKQITIEDLWELIECLPNLKALELIGVDEKRVDSAWLLRLANLKGLCHLSMTLDRDFTPQGLEELASSSLQSLCLMNVQSQAGLVEHIAKMPKLKWLKLQTPNVVRGNLSGDNLVAHLLEQASFDQVEYLDISSQDNARVLSNALARSFPNLKELKLDCDKAIDDPSELESLSALASLEYLEVSRLDNATQEALNALVGKMPRLQDLYITHRFRPRSGIEPASNQQGKSVSIRFQR